MTAGAADIGRHVLVLTAAGSFTVEGRRLTDPVDTAGKLGKLILWSVKRGGCRRYRAVVIKRALRGCG